MNDLKLKRYFERLLPLLTVPLAQLAAYYGSRLLAPAGPGLNLALPLDGSIPLCTPFIAVYLLAYVQWVVCYLLLVREGRELRHRICAGHLVAEMICLLFYVLVPTEMVRPEVVGQGLFAELTRFIYRIDAPNNLFPSIHCMQSWLCLRMALQMKRTPCWHALFTWAFSLLVMASTVLVKQHVLLDVPAGILAAEAGLFLARKFRLERIFDPLCKGEME